MPLRVVRSQSLADQVFAQLGEEILSGRYPPGTQIPAERKLVETFGVNRHVVREAIKRLEQINLVEVSQGGGTTVLDYRKKAGLDLLSLMAERATAEEDAMKYWLAVHEMRRVVASDAARLCAERATAEERASILAIANEMREASDGDALFPLDLRFWEEVIDGARNLAYRLAYNTMVKGVTAAPVVQLARSWGVHEVKESSYRVPIATAIANGDAHQAENATREAMREVVEVLVARVLGGAAARPPVEGGAKIPGTFRAVKSARAKAEKKGKPPARASRRG